MSMADRFLNFFPTPKFLSFPTVGVDISTNHVRFVELVKDDSDCFCLGRYGTKLLSLPEKWSDEDRFRSLVEVLAQIKKETGFKETNVSLPEEQTFFFNMKLELNELDRARERIEFSLEEYIPYNPAEVVFDYKVIAHLNRENQVLVNVAVASKKVTDQYAVVFEKAGIRPIIFEVEAEAAARAIIPKNSKDFFMIVNIGSENTILSMVNKETVWLSNTLKIGGDFLNQAIAQKLSIDIKKAEELKWSIGLRKNSAMNDKILDSIMPAISSIRDEINRHYKYWHTHKTGEEYSGRRIKKILLCGSQAGIIGLDDYLSASLGLDFSLSNPWVNLSSFEHCIPDISYSRSLGYVTSIGSAMANI